VPAPQAGQDPFGDRPLPIQDSSTTIGVSNVDPATISNRTVLSGSVPSATSLPLDISPLPALLVPPVSREITPPSTAAAALTLKSEVAPQMYNGGNVTEIPFVDESSKRELLLLLGN